MRLSDQEAVQLPNRSPFQKTFSDEIPSFITNFPGVTLSSLPVGMVLIASTTQRICGWLDVSMNSG